MKCKIFLVGSIPIGMDSKDAENVIKEMIPTARYEELSHTVAGIFAIVDIHTIRSILARGLRVEFFSAANELYDARMLIGEIHA